MIIVYDSSRRPARPVLSANDGSSRGRLWDWFVEIQLWETSVAQSGRDLAEVVAEYQLLINEYERLATSRNELKMFPAFWEATFRWKLGNCCFRMDRIDDAIEHLQEAKRIEAGNLESRMDLVKALLAAGRVNDAIWEINSFEIDQVRNLKGSAAEKILNWAYENEAVALGLDARLVKACVALVARHGSGERPRSG